MEPNEVGELKEQAEKGGEESALRPVAFFMSVIAVLVAVTTVLGHRTHTDAVLNQAKASDKWNESQAESIKEKELVTQKLTLEIMKRDLSAEDRKKLADYGTKKEEHRIEAKRKHDESEAHVRKHLPLSLGLTMFQVGIAIGAISALTKQKAFWFVSIAIGAAGVGFFAWGLLL